MKYRNLNEYIKTTITAILIAQSVLPVGMVQANSWRSAGNKDNLPVATAPRADAEQNTLLRSVLVTVKKRYENILTQMPADLQAGIANERSAGVSAAVAEKIKGLKDGTIQVADFRAEMVALAQKNLDEQKKEIFYQLQNMSNETLDALSAKLEGNRNYADARQEYAAAYTRTEKANALSRAVWADLDHLFTMTTKQTNFMTDKAFIGDLSRLQSIYATKDWDSKKWLTAVGLAVLGIAVTGLVTWGIASAVYSGRYNDRVSQLDQHYNQVRAQLEDHYNNLNTHLTQDEQDYLSSHGFVYTTCANYQAPDSIQCNRYNYQVFSGNKLCTVNCYKNSATGQQTLQSAPTCTSPFIPADCYDPSEYTRGYNDGAVDGNYDGNYDGYTDGRYDGAYDGYNDGYADGKYDGYQDGYSDGYADGYNSYWGKGLSSILQLAGVRNKTMKRGAFYDRGYQEGQRDVLNILKLAANG